MKKLREDGVYIQFISSQTRCIHDCRSPHIGYNMFRIINNTLYDFGNFYQPFFDFEHPDKTDKWYMKKFTNLFNILLTAKEFYEIPVEIINPLGMTDRDLTGLSPRVCINGVYQHVEYIDLEYSNHGWSLCYNCCDYCCDGHLRYDKHECHYESDAESDSECEECCRCHDECGAEDCKYVCKDDCSFINKISAGIGQNGVNDDTRLYSKESVEVIYGFDHFLKEGSVKIPHVFFSPYGIDNGSWEVYHEKVLKRLKKQIKRSIVFF